MHPDHPPALTLRVEFAGFCPAQANSICSSCWSWSTRGHRWHRSATSTTLSLPDGVSTAKPEPVGSISLCISPLFAVCRALGGISVGRGGDFGLGALGAHPSHPSHPSNPSFPWKLRCAAPWGNLGKQSLHKGWSSLKSWLVFEGPGDTGG